MLWRASKLLLYVLSLPYFGLTALPPGASGQAVVPIGDDVEVNSYTDGDQSGARTASAPDGNFVVVWSSLGSPGTDQDGASIQGRRFSVDGLPLGAQFQVNDLTASHQHLPSVAVDLDGSFVVVWATDRDVPRVPTWSIQARRFSAAGVPLGAQFQVNQEQFGTHRLPWVAIEADGNFLVTWTGASPGDPIATVARRFWANGTPRGDEFRVNDDPTPPQFRPVVATRPTGGFMIVWDGVDEDVDGFGVRGRVFDANGSPLGPSFEVNEYTDLFQGHASVASVRDGFIVAWHSNGSFGDDTGGLSIQARRFGPDGQPLGPQFQVNLEIVGNQAYPNVAASPDGGFLLTWMSGYLSEGGDGSGPGVRGRLYAADGSPLGDEFIVNGETRGEQGFPFAASQPGGFVVTWLSEGAPGNDTSGYGVRARRLAFQENAPPIARCRDVTAATEPEVCVADASIDADSTDPDGEDLVLTQDPPGPYPAGETRVTLRATDPEGASDSCQALVTVVDLETPRIACNAPATLSPPEAPIAFQATASDNCGVAALEVAAPDCFRVTKTGRRIAKQCRVEATGDTIVISRTGGVGSRLDWTALAHDTSGRVASMACGLEVVRPEGPGPNR